MRELDEVLAAGLAAREEGMPDAAPAGVLGRVVGRVRHNRARRHALQGVTAFVAAVVLGGAGWWSLHRDVPEPAVTPEPTTSAPTPTSAPSPTGTPEEPMPTPEMVEVQGLPSLPKASPELVTTATSGWVLATYVLSDRDWYDSPDFPATVRTLLLVSPDGERFHLLDLPLDKDVHVERWEAGTSFADARVYDDAGGWVWLRIDLLNGEITEAGTPSPPVETPYPEHNLGWSWDGRRVVAYYDDPGIDGYTYPETAVYLRAFDGTQTRVQAVTWLNRFGGEPVLDPSGTRLLF